MTKSKSRKIIFWSLTFIMTPIPKLFFFSLPIFILCTFPANSEENCEFSYVPENTKLIWTAFKFTEKTGVNGTLKNIQVQKTKPAPDALGAVRSIKFTIDSKSSDTGNPDRDAKLNSVFFGSLKNREIKGIFKDVQQDKNSGTAKAVLTWNGVTATIPVQFKVNNETDIEVTGSLNVNSWKMQNALGSLNKVCEEQHRSKDGLSKLWPDVDFKISTKLLKRCKNAF